jgi:hypothetical protein
MRAERRRQVELRYGKAAVHQGKLEAPVKPAIGCDIGEIDRIPRGEVEDRVCRHRRAVDPQCLRCAGEERYRAAADRPRNLRFEGPAAEIRPARIGICCRQHRGAQAALHNVAAAGNDARFNKSAAVPELQRAVVGDAAGHGPCRAAVSERQGRAADDRSAAAIGVVVAGERHRSKGHLQGEAPTDGAAEIPAGDKQDRGSTAVGDLPAAVQIVDRQIEPGGIERAGGPDRGVRGVA